LIAGLLFTKPSAPDKIEVKGIQAVRRDMCPLVEEVTKDILEAIMYDKDPAKAIDVARRHVSRLLAGDIDMSKFVVSKTLRGGYKNATQPHVYVANKLRARRGSPVNYGERVPYVFVEDPTKAGCVQAERAEDPAYALANGLKMDRLYYLKCQLTNPIKSLLELFVQDPEKAVFEHPSVAPLLRDLQHRMATEERAAKRVRVNQANHQQEITKWLVPKKPAAA
jgi:DNA polymerase delta subunit 1